MTASRKILTSAPTSVELDAQLLAEREALEQAEVSLAELRIERDAALLADSDAPLADAEQAQEACRRQRDRHAARIELLERAHDDAVEAERHAAAVRRYEAAQGEIDAARKWMMNEYPRAAAELAEGLARIKAADQLADRVNRYELPTGCTPLGGPSLARHEPSTPDRTETRYVWRWVDQSCQPIGAAQYDENRVPNVAGARLREVPEQHRISGERPWQPLPLYESVGELPGLHRSDRRFWPPEG